MDADLFQNIRTILELGWPAIVLIMLFMLWRAYMSQTQRYIEDLRRLSGLEGTVIKAPASSPPSPMVKGL